MFHREVTSNSAQLDTMTSSVIVGLGQEWDPSQFWFLKWDQLEISQENLKKSRQIKSLIGIMRFEMQFEGFAIFKKVLNCDILIFVLIGTGRKYWKYFGIFLTLCWPLHDLCYGMSIQRNTIICECIDFWSWIFVSSVEQIKCVCIDTD